MLNKIQLEYIANLAPHQSTLPHLKDVLFIGNPMYDEVSSRRDARIEILKYLPNVSKIDGEMVKPSERDEAKQKLNGA